jgi:hypothetical protein
MAATQTQKTNHIQRLIKAVNALLAAAAQCRDVNAEAQSASPGLGYIAGGPNALVDSDFAAAGSPCAAADYNAILTALEVLETSCNAAGANGTNSVWQELRLLSR